MPVYTDGSRLCANNLVELHHFATKIGLNREHFVISGTEAYYYIPGGDIALLRALSEGVHCVKPEQIQFKTPASPCIH